jgi:hypothetical protein
VLLSKQPFSYKDPSGFVVEERGIYYRYITYHYQQQYDHFLASGLYDQLIKRKWMVSHNECMLKAASKSYYKLILPEQVEFITYPFEWTYSQWREAAILFTEINLLALQYGMILKDATPYNFTFHKGKCILMDTLSFDFYKEGEPWLAYREFCSTFLGPIALMKYKGQIWSRLSRVFLKGFPLKFISKSLPLISWFNITGLLHLHLHAFFQNPAHSSKPKSYFSTGKLQQLHKQIRNQLILWKEPKITKSIWTHYYEKDIESNIYQEDKNKIIEQWISEIKPLVTIDIGANTGRYCKVAAKFSQRVIGIEEDMEAAEIGVRDIKQSSYTNIQLLQADIAEPSPGLGWINLEKKDLLSRMKGDTVLALAVLHHLCIGKNLPLSFTVSLFNQMTTESLIIEFVSREDAKVQLMLSQREDIFSAYNETNFMQAMQSFFELKAVYPLADSHRTMFWWRKRSATF